MDDPTPGEAGLVTHARTRLVRALVARGRGWEALDNVRRLLACPDEPGDFDRKRIHLQEILAQAYRTLGHFEPALQAQRETYCLAREAGLNARPHLRSLAVLHGLAGHAREARSCLVLAMRELQRHPDPG